jgi:hypothetical protein
MGLWTDVDISAIELVPIGKERHKFTLDGQNLRFQIPRGFCTWGVSQFKSMNLEIRNPDFIKWWKDLETQLCPQEPFKSNLSSPAGLRLKIDEATYIFDENSKQVNPDIREGLFRGQELSCLVDVESTYFFNGNWGLTCKAVQVRFYGAEERKQPGDVDATSTSTFSLPKGRCAFLEESAS